MDILTNKTAKTSKYFSRYSGLNYYYNKLDKKEQLENVKWLSHDMDYYVYKVKDGDTYDSISLVHYNNPTYYWVICDFNRILDPIKKPEVGTLLYLPVISSGLKYEEY